MKMNLIDMWNESKGTGGKIYDELPDGKYFAKVCVCKHGVTRNNLPKIDRAKQDFIDLGLAVESDVLTNTMVELTGNVIEFEQRTSTQGLTFFNFKRVIGSEEAIPL